MKGSWLRGFGLHRTLQWSPWVFLHSYFASSSYRFCSTVLEPVFSCLPPLPHALPQTSFLTSSHPPSQLPCADFHCCIVNYLLGQSWSQNSRHRQRPHYIRYKVANTIVRGFLISGQNCSSVSTALLHPCQIRSILQRSLLPSLAPLQMSTQ